MAERLPHKILITDDDPSSALLAEAALDDAGYRVVVANNGEEALERFESERPDCIVLDVMMPGLSGFDVCRAVRAHPRGKRIPILMLTNLGDHASISESYNAGASDFTQKGRSPRLLVERVRFLLRDRSLEEDRLSSQSRLEQAQRIARVGHWEFSRTGESLGVSSIVCELLGRRAQELGHYEDFLAMLSADAARAMREAFRSCATGEGGFACNHRLEGPGGETLYLHQEAQLTHAEEDPQQAVVLVTLQDVTRLQRAEDTARTLTYTDVATGLANRRHYEEQVALALRAPEGIAQTTVLAVRIQNLDRAVAAHGEGFGSALVTSVSRRVAGALGTLWRSSVADGEPVEDALLVARIGGDELGVLIRGDFGADRIAAATDVMLRSVARPVECLGIEYVPVASAGISVAAVDGAAADALILHAHIAANQVADVGGYCFYSEELQTRARRRVTLESDLRVAIERGQLNLVYQPRINLGDRAVTSVEALVRWDHPQLGAVSPNEFIPIAEQSGVVCEIGRWALDRACEQLACWRAAGLQTFRVAVNLSPRQLADPDLASAVHFALTRHGLPATALELELTETCIITADEQAHSTLEALRATGVQVALDDFGTGYSSLAQIRRLPVDCVKLDRSLVADLRLDRGTQGIVAGVLAIARTLGIRSCAEGVEDASTLRMLKDLECDEVQGYFFAAPMVPAVLEEWLSRGGSSRIITPASDPATRDGGVASHG
jgi:predicted signal transduction protein with EAL and GGDEF domain/DNA-binding response OmpR family regulator